jgi:hypothetical protein
VVNGFQVRPTSLPLPHRVVSLARHQRKPHGPLLPNNISRADLPLPDGVFSTRTSSGIGNATTALKNDEETPTRLQSCIASLRLRYPRRLLLCSAWPLDFLCLFGTCHRIWVSLRINSAMGTMEMVSGAAICGVLYALFSARPKVGFTGPLLAFVATLVTLATRISTFPLYHSTLGRDCGLPPTFWA